MNKIEGKTEGELQLYQVYNAINKHADQDAIYSIDVGDTTQTSTRHLHMTPKNMWRTSPLFATMGIALPGGIAAKKDNPDRQVWNIMGDGAFNMCYPDVITNVQYDLPVINVVFSNGKYAFIKDKYEVTTKQVFVCVFVFVLDEGIFTILEEKSRRFTEQNHDHLQQLLKRSLASFS